MESILLSSSKVWLAEALPNGNLKAKFLICDFSTNKNGVRLNRDTIESWMDSLINQPVAGKVVRSFASGKEDFAGHEMKKTYVKDDAGNLVETYTFDTASLGTFVSVGIETINGVECITAEAELWSRYPRTIRLIKDRAASGNLATSWEISVASYTIADDGVKVINDGFFKGLALLGSNVVPAYDSSHLLEVAEAGSDNELVSAMEADMKEIDMNKDKTPEVETAENVETSGIETVTDIVVENEIAEEEPAADVVDEQDLAEPESSEQDEDGNAEVADGADTAENAAPSENTETASLTIDDLRRKLELAIAAKLNQRWAWVAYMFPEEHVAWVAAPERESELDYILFTYETVGDDVIVDDGTPVKLAVSIASINETMAQKDAAIAAALAENEELKSQIAVLNEVKAKYDKILEENAKVEAEAKKEELRAYAMKSGLFTDGELTKGNAKKLIDALDQAGINQMIADRYMAQLAAKNTEKAVETSSAHVSASVDLTADDVKPIRNILRTYYED